LHKDARVRFRFLATAAFASLLFLPAPTVRAEPIQPETVVAHMADLVEVYLSEAACAGLSNPKPAPTILLRSGNKVDCVGVTPDGLCSGLHTNHPRRIYITYSSAASLPHEFLHDVLCQLPRSVNPYGCDPKHQSPLWQTCVL
jgi:hypothetical protein